jgi:threonine/homoserine/homoserine lactone efflux protein
MSCAFARGGVSAALPGPDTMLLLSRTLSSGVRAAATVAVGLTIGLGGGPPV